MVDEGILAYEGTYRDRKYFTVQKV